MLSKLAKYLLPYRTLTVLGQSSTRRYHFRLGQLISQESTITLSSVHQDDTFLIDDFPQDLQEGVAPPLKFFDRFPYMAQRLRQRFEISHWTGYRWLKNRRYLLGCVTSFALKTPPSVCANTGFLVGELLRYPVFEKGTGLILALQEQNGIRQIYVHHHVPVFIRFTTIDTLDVEKSIERLKRHLERYHQADLATLPILWWSPTPPPLSTFLHYQGLSFEETMVQSAAQHRELALPCYPQIPTTFFSKLFLARFTLRGLQCLSMVGLLGGSITLSSLFFLFLDAEKQDFSCNQTSHHFISSSTLDIKLSQIDHDLKQLKAQTPSHLIPIIETYRHFISNALQGPIASPLGLLKKLKPSLQPACQLQEIFWGRGQTQIDPKELTMTFTPDTLDKSFFRQTLVLAFSADTIQQLQDQQQRLKGALAPHLVALWEIQQESTTASFPVMKPVSALIHYQEEHS